MELHLGALIALLGRALPSRGIEQSPNRRAHRR
eukprot:CAMPEP_0204602816 /NCGR_PEP_ID=MMETSP0661-20131031/56889_1 /ASSEMBLY_ACC=CAM_ASM_000606 /TAXON_ID=109239 /ORGANISM="Alexandrium margalefi, Strain AMGDE01CS-322" /LENGTH=32 /DNA_ID= /DNA_START= /DNA_END= /DNA_ORIENTATION=